ncbi:MAG TPA: hypothetical protein VFU64_02895 [Gaiellaceae bacterium]|nr:hypothetical protein [Gaiellaceae bacterium]
MRRSILACGLVLAFAGMATAAAAAVGSGTTAGVTAAGTTDASTTTTSTTATTTAWAGRRAFKYWSRHVRRSRAGTRRWLTVIRGRPPRSRPRSLSVQSLAGLRQLARRWHRRERRAWRRAKHPPNFGGWLCIHRYEGSWSDSGAPYWGGLQMDLSFQATYGRWLLRHKGTADHWSPLEQIWVAVRASRTRGFSPWPNTARYCGMA